MSRRRKWGPNPSNPFITNPKGLEHLPGVIELPSGHTISMPVRTKQHGSGADEEAYRLFDSFNGGKKGS